MSCEGYKLLGSSKDDGCNRKSYCSLRECIKDKVGESSVLPPELQDQISDLLRRMAALENKKLEVTLPGGTAFLTGSFCIIPKDGKVKCVLVRVRGTIQAIGIYRNSQTLLFTMDPTGGTFIHDCDYQVHRGDAWFVEVGVVGDDGTAAASLEDNEASLSPVQTLEQKLDWAIKKGQISLLQNTGNWHPENLSGAERSLLTEVEAQAEARTVHEVAITTVLEFAGETKYLTWGDME